MSSIKAFVRLKDVNHRESIYELVHSLGGQIAIEFAESTPALIIDIPKDKLYILPEVLERHPDIVRLYTSYVPRSTIQKYSEALKSAAHLYHTYLRSMLFEMNEEEEYLIESLRCRKT